MRCGRISAPIICACTLAAISCSALHVRRVERYATAKIALPEKESSSNDPGQDSTFKDTLIIRNVDGHDMILMKSIRDDDGQMVANQVLEAAKVTAHFKNIAERHGRIRLSFQITVPRILMDDRWQLRYTPVMYILGDSLLLEKVYVTGKEYRRRQYRGYQQYERFLSRIISNDSLFIDRHSLELFIERNLPVLYAFRSDTCFVSDEDFNSAFGVSEQEAVDHYTNILAKRSNDRRRSMRDKMYRRYIKTPLHGEGIRIDTMVTDLANDFVYDYVQIVTTRPRLKRIDIALDGAIFESDRPVCGIKRSDTLNFYVSSLSSFVDDSPRYLTKVIERVAMASMSYDIAFRSASSTLDEKLGENATRMQEIREHLKSLSTNDVFVLDSLGIVASASPEGDMRYNKTLSSERSKSICRHLESFLKHYRDSLDREEGYMIRVDERNGTKVSRRRHDFNPISFKPGSIGENWDYLKHLVAWDVNMDDGAKAEFERMCKDPMPDRRERAMASRPWYPYMRNELYPKLRNVNFTFHLHRKGMVKDTIHTTVLDTVYMEGVQAIKDRDFDRAIEILRPYNDYNTAVAYCAKDFNYSALSILSECPPNAMVHYMLALIKARLGETAEAVEYYMKSCAEDPRYIHRGNLDPEIHTLIKTYNINF